jgi:3-hydroxybutyrate dehydrogenase
MFFIARQTEPMFRLSSGLQRTMAQGIFVTVRFSGKPLVMSIFFGYSFTVEKQFAGKRAIVVGGTGGLGLAVSRRLQEAGAAVLAIGRHHVDKMEIFEINLDNPSSHDTLVEIVADVDILCVARGPFLQKSLCDMIPSEWDAIVSANLTFPGKLVSSSLPGMIAKQWGRILLFGGTRTDLIRGFRTNAAYAAAKTGLASLAKSVALEYAKDGITCNVICPGLSDTEYLNAETRASLARKNPDGTLIGAQTIADAALFLLSNPECNGVAFPVDKGWAPA